MNENEFDAGRGGIGAVIDAVERLAEIDRIEDDDEHRPGLLVTRTSTGKAEVVDLKPYWDKRRYRPERREGVARFTRLHSLIDHANRFKDLHSVIYADDNPDRPSITIVLDYHEGLQLEKGSDWVEQVGAGPRFGRHRGFYAFPLSDEWKAWHAIDEQGWLEQSELAAFLEEHLADVADPASANGQTIAEFKDVFGAQLADPARLATLANGLNVRVDQQVSNVSDPSTGEATLHYQEAHRAGDGGPLKVPRAFALGIQVVKAGAYYQIPVRLRYRVRQGKIRWSIDLHRTERIFADAFDEACVKVRDGVNLPLYFGTPE